MFCCLCYFIDFFFFQCYRCPDYIRTYTWDKKLESWVKETGLLGGGGKEPTILSPKLYQKRFIESMKRYFLLVAEKWTDPTPFR